GATTVIENRVGAGGRIAAEFVARQPADGYTVLVGATGQMSIATSIFPDLGYHASNSFIPLNMIASFPLVLVVPADHSAKDLKELIAWAKANPEKSNYGTSSPAFTIASELLKLKSGMPAVGIPYKSSNESNLSVVSGHSLFTICDGPPVLPRVGALPRAARCAEHGRSRISGRQHRVVERVLRSCRHAGSDRRQADGGIRQGACRSCGSGWSSQDGR